MIALRLHALTLTIVLGLLVALASTSFGHEHLADRMVEASPHQERERTEIDDVDQAWWDGSDFLVEGLGSASGYTVYVRRESERYTPRPVATIQPNGDGSDAWLGYTCVTGDGKTAVVNLAQRWVVNEPAMRDRAGLLYSVNLRSGRVRTLASGVAFKYHAVGCGTGTDVTYVAHLGDDQERSEVFLGHTGGGFDRVADVKGQLTSPVPVDGTVMALRGQGVVELVGGRERLIERVAGEPYRLRPNAVGSVDLLVRVRDRVHVVRADEDGSQLLAEGPFPGTGLEMGRHGRTVAMGASARRPATGFSSLPEAIGGTGAGPVSIEGKVSLAPVVEAVASPATPAATTSAIPRLHWTADGSSIETVAASGGAADTYADLPPITNEPALVRSSEAGSAGQNRALEGTDPTATVTATSAATPVCGVARNLPTRQAYSATSTQVDWAVQMAVRNLLKGSFVRPADYLKSGLPSYSPSSDFPVPALAGAGGTIPPAVMNGVLAQESAYRHASRRTLPGNGGNPLVGDYYGAEGTIDKIDYTRSDCGYGIAQVTSGMRIDEGSITPNGKAKVAIDYAENIQAGANILAKKWNQLYAAGIRLSNSDPDFVENWYTALWAYNSGLQPTAAYGNTTGCSPSPTCTDSHGHWGLGWTNNPANPDYPPDRSVFLRATYADAERPSDWPYQERVLGFAETAIFNYKGEASYAPTSGLVKYPDRFAFCLPSNECDPDRVDPTDPSLNYCTRVDNHCWFHQAVTGVDCSIAGNCQISPFTVPSTAIEPTGENPWGPPACDSHLGPQALIVDELPDPSKNLFCGARNWTNQGTFTYEVGTTTAADGSQLPLGGIDLHQIATGFGAHTWFAGNRLASDVSHRVTATWTPTLPSAASPYVIKVHIPRKGSSTTSAKYTITLANGTTTSKVINQHEHYDHWKSLGVFNLGPGSKVVLSNVTEELTPGSATVAFDAVAFVPAPGTIRKTTIESVAFFDDNTNIDTDTASSIFVWSPFESRQKMYDWAHGLATRVLSYPACSTTLGADCIAPNARNAFLRWLDEISAAGTTNAMTTWLNLANPPTFRPTTNAITPAWRTNDASYKVRNKVEISFVENNDMIVQGSEGIDLDDRTSDTHLPRFILDIMKAIQTDYGVELPDMTYSQVDLNEFDHQNTTANPTADGILPGQAQHQAAAFGGTSGACVGTIHVAGGTIGYRPMLATEYVPAAVESWSHRVTELEQAIPAGTLDKFAEDVYETFFQQSDMADIVPRGSAFNAAPPIWQELNVQFCADGTVKPLLGTEILRQSWMPDGYLYRDGRAISQSGASRTAATPLVTGDFRSFSTTDEQGRDNPYDDCDAGTGRTGNPWGISAVPWFRTNDHPDHAHLCYDKSLSTDQDLP